LNFTAGTAREGTEIARLHDYAAQVQHGVRQIIFVTGEAGSGKTTAVAASLEYRGVSPEGRDGVAAFVYRRTGGHPLFMVQGVDDLAQQGRLQAPVQTAVGGTVGEPLDQALPHGLHQLLEAHLGRLDVAEQQVLWVGGAYH
jgi:predicted ATPase